MRSLVLLRVDTRVLGYHGRSALHLAVYSGSVACMQVLIEDCGVPIEIRNEQKKTLLHVAALCDHTQCINVLVFDYGADVNAQDVNGDTPLHWACRKGQQSAVQALRSHPNCDVNMTNNKGKTAKELAMENDHEHIVLCFSHSERKQREPCAVKVKNLKDRDAIAHRLGAMSIRSSDDSKLSGMKTSIIS